MEWIDRAILKVVVIGVIIGTTASSIRAIADRVSIRVAALRIVAGALTAGSMAYILRDIEMPSFIYGMVLFAAGYSFAEVSAIISNLGKRNIPQVEEETENAHDDHETDEPKPNN